MAKRVRRPTVCQACGYSSYNGRVCRDCLDYYGGPVENVLAAKALERALRQSWIDCPAIDAGLTEEEERAVE